jgi:hypothetical protein
MTIEQSPTATTEVPASATALKAEIETLQAGITHLEALVVARQIEFKAALGCDHAEELMAELLRMTADLMSAREAAIRLKGELIALRILRRSRPWWWRMLGG